VFHFQDSKNVELLKVAFPDWI